MKRDLRPVGWNLRPVEWDLRPLHLRVEGRGWICGLCLCGWRGGSGSVFDADEWDGPGLARMKGEGLGICGPCFSGWRGGAKKRPGRAGSLSDLFRFYFTNSFFRKSRSNSG